MLVFGVLLVLNQSNDVFRYLLIRDGVDCAAVIARVRCDLPVTGLTAAEHVNAHFLRRWQMPHLSQRERVPVGIDRQVSYGKVMAFPASYES